MFTLDMDILTRNPGAGVIKAMRGFLAFQASCVEPTHGLHHVKLTIEPDYSTSL